MKFGKEFEAQMVQEWREAYMDYGFLKTVLKDVLRFRQKNAPQPEVATTKRAVKRRVSLYRAFSGLTNRCRNSPRKNEQRGEDEPILVTSTEESGEGTDGKYHTMFLMSSDEGGQFELVFFRRLDDEFNKVVNFYKQKVEEVLAEAEELSKQMNALIALRIKVDDPVLGGKNTVNLDSNAVLASFPLVTNRKPGVSRMETIKEVQMTNERELDGIKEVQMSNGRELDGENIDQREKSTSSGTKRFKPAQLDVLDHVKINVEPENPVSTLKSVIKSQSEKSFSKKELKKAEELMTSAFIEFYQKLRLLKSYCFLNQLALSKIMKKYDKITSRNASKSYLKMVDNSYLGSSEEVTKLLERVETTFVKHFANGNHRKGMDTLRPKAKRERHTISFFLGTFFGFSLALLVAIVVAIHARNILKSHGRNKYMENIFPLYSLFGYMVLHMLMYSGNIFFWKRYRVNYSFIFGFKQGTELGYREVLLLSSGLAVLTFASVLSNLDMEMDPRTKSFGAITELVPLGLLTIVILITFCPFNIIYRSSRFFLIKSTLHCICAPLYKVTLSDFFLADQLTSQVQALRSLEFYVCYYVWGDFKRRSNECYQSKIFQKFYIVVAIIPYWLRFLQCFRRLVEENDGEKGTLLIIAIVSSIVATVFNTYWDIVMDWGLLHRNSRNPWLRDKIIIPNKSIYFVVMVVNVFLRLAWMQTVLGIREAPFLHRTALTAVVASLEIIRRGIWNFSG